MGLFERCRAAWMFYKIWGVLIACPICALEEINELHGLPYGTPFKGEQAKHDYEEAWDFLNA
jgi:hypothetical protein